MRLFQHFLPYLFFLMTHNFKSAKSASRMVVSTSNLVINFPFNLIISGIIFTNIICSPTFKPGFWVNIFRATTMMLNFHESQIIHPKTQNPFLLIHLFTHMFSSANYQLSLIPDLNCERIFLISKD